MMYLRNKGVCWTSSSAALIPMGGGRPILGIGYLVAWALFMAKAS